MEIEFVWAIIVEKEFTLLIRGNMLAVTSKIMGIGSSRVGGICPYQ